MSAETKIWFVYLSDHHEGPFTPEEVAEKVKQGVVTAQSLGWKDGMPEWVPLEAIPELKSALDGAGAAGAAGDDGFSLAQMLASQQQGGAGAGGEAAESPSEFTGATSVLNSMTQTAMSNNPVGTGSLSIGLSDADAGGAPTSTKSAAPVGPDEEVWTLKIGSQVSGLHSLNKLKAIAGDGEIPPDATLWRKGWSDFQTLAAVPEVAQARKAKKMMGGTKTGLTGTNKNLKFGGKAAAPAADIGDEEPTDPNIALTASTQKNGFKAILAKITSLIKSKKTAAAAKAMAKNPSAKVAAAQAGIGKRMASMGNLGERLKKVAMILGVVLVIGGGGAAYFLFFSSPIPSDLDVIAEDLEKIQEAAKGGEGPKVFLALARGTEDNPADDTSPKFYVAASLPDGSDVTLQLTGQPGTLVNRPSFQKTFTAKVTKNLATFESVQDDGKPLPMGEYDLKVSADGVDPFTVSRFLGGKKGGIYQDRLKRYKEKLQGEYDKEMAELKELIDTLKSMNTEITKRAAEYKASVTNPSLKGKVSNDWRSYSMGAQVLVGQIDQKVKAKLSNSASAFHPRAVQDVATTLANVQSFFQAHTQRLEGAAPATNPDELELAITTSTSALEQWLAQALIKSPLDVLSAAKEEGAAASAPVVGTPLAPAAPAKPATASPTTPPPAP
jgi:hypothetical protein